MKKLVIVAVVLALFLTANLSQANDLLPKGQWINFIDANNTKLMYKGSETKALPSGVIFTEYKIFVRDSSDVVVEVPLRKGELFYLGSWAYEVIGTTTDSQGVKCLVIR